MRIAPLVSAFLFAFAALASRGEPASMEAPLVFGPPLGGSVTYRFTVDAKPSVDANGAPAESGDDSNRRRAPGSLGPEDGGIGGDGPDRQQRPPEIAPIVVRFDGVDATHVRLTLVDLIDSDTILTDRAPDGQLRAKLKHRSRWARPIATYDRLARLTAAGNKLALGGEGTASLEPAVSDEKIAGEVVRSRAGSMTTLAFDGSGDVVPSGDFAGGPTPGGANGDLLRSVLGGLGGAMGGGGMGGGRGGGMAGPGGMGGGPGGAMGGGRGGMGGGPDGAGGGQSGTTASDADARADVTVATAAHYATGVFSQASGTETIERRGALPLGVTWVVANVPDAAPATN